MPPKKTASTIKEKPAAKKSKTLKEKQITDEEPEPQKKKRAAAAKTADSNVKKPTKKKIAKEVPLPESENGAVPEKKVAKTKKTKSEETEKSKDVPGTSKTKKKTENKGKRLKKENDDEMDNEKDEASTESAKAPAKRAPKRKVAKSEERELEPAKEKKTKSASTTRSNATVTNWDSIDFNCTSKTPTGKSPNFHIISWNVDGMRAWIKKGGLDILKHDQPDILCLQETKCSEEKIPEEIKEVEGYESLWCCSDKEGYAGVGVLTKAKPLNVIYGIESEDHDDEGRSITVEYEHFYLVNVYVPNAGRKLVTLPKRLEWNKAFKTFIKKLDENKPVIICGDMNVAHKEIDLANPKTNTKNAGFTVEEREGMTDFLNDGYVDTFRELYPEKEKAYTFWTYMANARTKNVGWRLDYFIISERFKNNICDNIILQDVLGSDHCPIVLHVNI